MQNTSHSQRRYPAELRERAIRMVVETVEQTKERHGVISRVAEQLGVGPESLWHWVRRAEVDGGPPPGRDHRRPAAHRRARA